MRARSRPPNRGFLLSWPYIPPCMPVHMSHRKLPLALSAALLTLTTGGLLVADGRLLATQPQQPNPFKDDDLDGLDNALEWRLGLNHLSGNTDGDLADDLLEILLGTDPAASDPGSSFPNPAPQAALESYRVGNAFVLQASVLRKKKLKKMHFYVAKENPGYQGPPDPELLTARLGQHLVSRYLTGTTTLPLAGTDFEIQSFRIVLPSAPFVQAGNFAIAFVAEVDHGVKVGDEIRYTTSGNTLMEWRVNPVALTLSDSAQGSSVGGQGGGLFPADPLSGPPIGENLINQVCVQELGVSGLTGVGVLYSITDAYCDTMVGAVCLESCVTSGGGTVVGLDLPSLLQ